jgi:RNA polymerase sigma-70 factor (ECF subfamily)
MENLPVQTPDSPSDERATAGAPTSNQIDDLLQRAYGFALALTHDATRAEDLVQDAWVSVIRARGPWTRRFVFTVIRNRFIDQFRRERKLSLESLDQHPEAGAEAEERLWDVRLSPLSNGEVGRALGRLRPEEREALVLSAVEGYTAQEIAELWNSPRGTVLSLMHRARHKLRRWLSPDRQEDPTP